MKELILFVSIFFSVIMLFLIIAKIHILKKNRLLNRQVVFKFLDRILLIISAMVIIITLLWDFNYLRYKAPIPHKHWETITLNDFRGLKKPFDSLYGESKFAFVSTSIRVKKKHNEIEIETLFHPCRSYVYNRKLFANYLLTHEMYHFHITEYCARMMRKEVKDLLESDNKVNLKEIKNRILIKEQELQYQYDDETYHSYVHSKQVEWQNKIDSSLVSLEKYSNSIISLKN
jgi:hypothetical protein